MFLFHFICTIFVLENIDCTSLPKVLAQSWHSINGRSRWFEMSSYEWMWIVETIMSLRNAFSSKSQQTWPSEKGVNCAPWQKSESGWRYDRPSDVRREKLALTSLSSSAFPGRLAFSFQRQVPLTMLKAESRRKSGTFLRLHLYFKSSKQ